MSAPLLDITGLKIETTPDERRNVAAVPILRGVDLTLERGEVVGLIGESGAGKSTLVQLLLGLLKPDSGQLERASGLRIGYMPQTAMVFDDLTVQENLSLGRNGKPPDRYFDLFPRLAERLKQPAGTMSGGERKILAFVRTMIEDTKLIILDEPSEGVQPENIDRMAGCLKERVAEGAGVLLCEQNLNMLAGVSDLFLGIDSGRVSMTGTAASTSREDLNAVLML